MTFCAAELDQSREGRIAWYRSRLQLGREAQARLKEIQAELKTIPPLNRRTKDQDARAKTLEAAAVTANIAILNNNPKRFTEALMLIGGLP